MSSRRVKKTFRDREEEGSEERCSDRSEDDDYPSDSDSLEEFEAGQTDEGNIVKGDSSSFRKSFSYGTLANANYAGGSFFSSMKVNSEDEGWVYYSKRKSDVGYSVKEDVVTEPLCDSLPLTNHLGRLMKIRQQIVLQYPSSGMTVSPWVAGSRRKLQVAMGT